MHTNCSPMTLRREGTIFCKTAFRETTGSKLPKTRLCRMNRRQRPWHGRYADYLTLEKGSVKGSIKGTDSPCYESESDLITF